MQIQIEYKQCSTNFFFINLITLRAFVLWTEEFQINMANNAKVFHAVSRTLRLHIQVNPWWRIMAEMEMSLEFFTLLLFTQFFMSDAADSFLPLSGPFYSGLISAGCVLNSEKLRRKSKEVFGGREGRRADESDGDFGVEVKSEL